MKTKEIRLKSPSGLESEIAEQREILRRARFDLAAGRVKNIRQIRGTRRSIARLLTVLKEMRKSASE